MTSLSLSLSQPRRQLELTLAAPSSQSELWQPLICSSCDAPIGRRFLQPHPTVPSSTIKLHKYAIQLPGQAPPPFSAFLCQNLLELADSHRSYHFILEAEDSEGSPRLLVRPPTCLRITL